MVSGRSHGGGCCGARHLQGFAAAENATPHLIDNALRTLDSGRMVEVILNGTQVQAYPNVLHRLADLGFVFDGHWMNSNHDSHNYRFTRCDRRRPLVLAGWDGMVADPRLEGDLTPNRTAGQGAVPRDYYVRPFPSGVNTNEEGARLYRVPFEGNIGLGSHVRVARGTSRHVGREGTVIGYNQYDDVCSIRFDEGVQATLVRRSLDLVRRGEAGDYRRRPRRGDRVQCVYENEGVLRGAMGTVHSTYDNYCYVNWDDPSLARQRYHRDTYLLVREDIPLIEAPAAQRTRTRNPERHQTANLPANQVLVRPERRLVLTTWHGVSRDGTRGAGYDTREDCARNLGRRTRIDRRDIFDVPDQPDLVTEWTVDAQD